LEYNESASLSQNSEIILRKTDFKMRSEIFGEDGKFISKQEFQDPQVSNYKLGVALRPTGRAFKSLSAAPSSISHQPARIKIAIMGDGYTAEDMSLFQQDAETLKNTLFNEEPFKTYKNIFEIYIIPIVSNERGADFDNIYNGLEENSQLSPTQITDSTNLRNTALGCAFWGSNGILSRRILTCNTQKVIEEGLNISETNLFRFVLINSANWGGSANSYFKTAYHTRNANLNSPISNAAIDSVIHELGHSLGLLADEYDYPGGTCFLDLPNAVPINQSEMLIQKRGWYNWLGINGIGSFEGACYQEHGWYRPTETSKMRDLFAPFYEVNTEQLITQFYTYVKPIDDASSGYFRNSNETLYVTPIALDGAVFSIQWYLNGKEIFSANTTTLDLSKLNILLQSTVSVKVTDNTTAVRNESLRASVMSQTISWRITPSTSTGTCLPNSTQLTLNESSAVSVRDMTDCSYICSSRNANSNYCYYVKYNPDTTMSKILLYKAQIKCEITEKIGWSTKVAIPFDRVVYRGSNFDNSPLLSSNYIDGYTYGLDPRDSTDKFSLRQQCTDKCHSTNSLLPSQQGLFYQKNCTLSIIEGSGFTNQPIQPKKILSSTDFGGGIRGYIEKIEAPSNNDTYDLKGWACDYGVAKSIKLALCVNGPCGHGGITIYQNVDANIPNEIGVDNACGTTGIPHRFRIPISLSNIGKYNGKPLYVHGISLSGKLNLQLLNDGTFSGKLPILSGIVGKINGFDKPSTKNDNYILKGWACDYGVAKSVKLALCVNAPCGHGGITLKQGLDANVNNGLFADNACGTTGIPHRFRIPISPSEIQKYKGKRLFVHGISLSGKSNLQLLNDSTFSGTFSDL
jgi:hypothetical protein